MSRSTVSRVCEQIKTQFDAWCARRLDEVELDYLFLDGSHFKYHAAAEPVLAAWGIDTAGKPVFVGLEAASSESGDAWRGFTQTPAGLRLLQDLRRSLHEPPTQLPQRRPDTEATPPETVSAIA